MAYVIFQLFIRIIGEGLGPFFFFTFPFPFLIYLHHYTLKFVNKILISVDLFQARIKHFILIYSSLTTTFLLEGYHIPLNDQTIWTYQLNYFISYTHTFFSFHFLLFDCLYYTYPSFFDIISFYSSISLTTSSIPKTALFLFFYFYPSI